MITYRLADLPVAFCHKHPPQPSALLDYRTDEAPLLSCEVCEGDILRMAEELTALRGDSVPPIAIARCETFALYLALAERLPLYDGFLMHAAFLSLDGEGVAILAPSGVGKSTLAKNLSALLGARCRIINGDKPLIREKDGVFYGYGTPFCGKEGWYLKEAAPLKKLLFLRRADTDTVTPMKAADAFPRLYEAVHPPKDTPTLSRLPSLLSRLLGTLTCYDAALTKGEGAAACVYQTLFGKEIPL